MAVLSDQDRIHLLDLLRTKFKSLDLEQLLFKAGLREIIPLLDFSGNYLTNLIIKIEQRGPDALRRFLNALLDIENLGSQEKLRISNLIKKYKLSSPSSVLPDIPNRNLKAKRERANNVFMLDSKIYGITYGE